MPVGPHHTKALYEHGFPGSQRPRLGKPLKSKRNFTHAAFAHGGPESRSRWAH